MSSPLDIPGLLALLNAQQLVLVPTPRAAQRLRDQFDQQQQARGLQAWEPPPLFAWSEWTETLWSTLLLEGADDRILLNRLQEDSLWTRVIADAAEASALSTGGARDLAQLARSALQLAAAYEALPRLTSTADSHETRTFVSWHKELAQLCYTDRLLPAALLETALVEHIRALRLTLPGAVHLTGFDNPTPAQKTLVRALEAAGCTATWHPLQTDVRREKQRQAVVAEDPRAELRWAAQFLQRHFSTNRPGSLGVAVVLPDPAAERPALEALLREHLAPELEPVHADCSSSPWHFSAGHPLGSVPLVQHALLLLRWLNEDLPLASVGTLLLSPFLTHTDEFEDRARFDARVLPRADPFMPDISLPKLLGVAERASNRWDTLLRLPEWRDVLRYAGGPHRLSGTGAHADWTEVIRKLLRLAGWPGPRVLSPAEFRSAEAFDSVLDLLATLDLLGKRVTFAEVVQLLGREVATIPAPNPVASASVEVLRLSETQGCLFNHVLVLRATDGNLPAPEQAHPLLSWRLQQSLGMPGTSAALVHDRSRRALLNLSDRCVDLFLLSSAADGTGPLRGTPLAAELGFHTARATLGLASESAGIEPELLTDTAALPPLPSPMVPGGARVLELQASCGFRAFADLRLRASVPEKKTLGMDGRQSGNVLHRALELFWKEVQTQQALQALGAEGRRAAVERGVSKAFRPIAAQLDQDDPWSRDYLRLLEQRLARLLEQWLAHELARADFSVLPPEQDAFISVGPLELKLRPDRIDKVEGGFVLVDYKTASALNTNQWLGERPEAPQLPLYALLGEAEEVLGLSFARVRPGKDMGWLSVQDRENLFPQKGSKLRNLTDQIELWKEELGRLATEFSEGRAEVDPKAYPTSCQYCDHRLLCRLDAATLLATEDDRETEEHDG